MLATRTIPLERGRWREKMKRCWDPRLYSAVAGIQIYSLINRLPVLFSSQLPVSRPTNFDLHFLFLSAHAGHSVQYSCVLSAVRPYNKYRLPVHALENTVLLTKIPKLTEIQQSWRCIVWRSRAACTVGSGEASNGNSVLDPGHPSDTVEWLSQVYTHIIFLWQIRMRMRINVKPHLSFT